LYRKSLEISRTVLGEEHLQVAASLNNLAQLLQAQGKYDEASELFHQRLAIEKRNLSEEHPRYANCSTI
jgi:tetratricopeptide (TPR) repeat protein